MVEELSDVLPEIWVVGLHSPIPFVLTSTPNSGTEYDRSINQYTWQITGTSNGAVHEQFNRSLNKS